MLWVVNREDVVQAALKVERWCNDTDCKDCPFVRKRYEDIGVGCKLLSNYEPCGWGLEEFLRTRGLKHERKRNC